MSICPSIDGAVLPTRQNGKTLPCANLAAENAKLRELVRDMWHDARLLDANHLIGGMRLTDLRKAEYESRMRELGVDA